MHITLREVIGITKKDAREQQSFTISSEHVERKSPEGHESVRKGCTKVP
jgi:hypothetical protein